MLFPKALKFQKDNFKYTTYPTITTMRKLILPLAFLIGIGCPNIGTSVDRGIDHKKSRSLVHEIIFPSDEEFPYYMAIKVWRGENNSYKTESVFASGQDTIRNIVSGRPIEGHAILLDYFDPKAQELEGSSIVEWLDSLGVKNAFGVYIDFPGDSTKPYPLNEDTLQTYIVGINKMGRLEILSQSRKLDICTE